MKESLRNLGEVEKLLEDTRQKEMESRVKLLFAEIRSIVGLFFRG